MCAILGSAVRYDELLPMTEERPLATLPFDCKYRLIDFPLSSIVNANIRTVFMIFNEGETRSVFDHIGGGKEWNLDGVQNRYFIHFYQDSLKKKAEGKPYYNTMIEYLKKSKSEYTVYLGSKMLCNIDLRAVLKIHQIQKNEMTMVYKRVEPSYVGPKDQLLTIDETGSVQDTGDYTAITSETEKVNLAMDIFIVQTEWLIQQLEAGQKENSTTNLKKFLREKITSSKSSTYEYTGYLSNIYDIPTYYQANMDMLNPQKFNSLLYSNQKIYTKLKNEVPTYYSTDSNVRNSQFATGCTIEGTVDHSLVFRGTLIEKDAVVKESMVLAGTTIEEGANVSYAILDKHVRVKAGVRIKGTEANPVVIQKNSVVTSDVIQDIVEGAV